MKNTAFYNTLIIVGVFMFVSVPYLFLKSDVAWIQLYASVLLLLSIVSTTIGVIGNIKAIKENKK